MFKIIFNVFILIHCNAYSLKYDLIETINYPIKRLHRQIDDVPCPIPKIENGAFNIQNPNLQYNKSDSFLPPLTVIKFQCVENLVLSPPQRNYLAVCDNGKWHNPIPKCVKKCRRRESNKIDFKCMLFGKEISCSEAIEDTTMTMTCKNNFSPYKEAICRDGYWTNPTITCDVTTECGVISNLQSTYVVKGSDAKQTEFPWHVGIYEKKDKFDYKCGGSIIQTNLILTAAHCITNDVNGRLNDIDNYYVAAGKFYSDYNSQLDKHVQKRHIIEARVSSTYTGYQNLHDSDIAVIIVNEPFFINEHVRLVCIDWRQLLMKEIFSKEALGYVPGWGVTIETEIMKISETLQSLSVPAVNYGECRNKTLIPTDTFKLISLDKFCAGYINGSGVCAGDSGGGLVFPYKKHGNTNYFIKGLVSSGATKLGSACDPTKYAIYTDVSFYLEFLQDVTSNTTILSLQDLNKISCPIPNIINGNFTTNLDYIVIDSIPPNTIIDIKCNDGYILTPSDQQNVNCTENGTWNTQIPKCERSRDCAAPTIENGKFTISGSDYTPGSVIEDYSFITIECNSGYKLSDSNKFLICKRGNWNHDIPKCILEVVEPSKSTESEKCPIPKIKNGHFEVLGNDYIPNTLIPNYAILNFSCNSDNYALSTSYNNIICLNGEYPNELPKCVLSCPPVSSTSVDLQCQLQGIEVDCAKRVPEWSILSMKCKPFYQQTKRGPTTAICRNGFWDVPIQSCFPVCGELNPKSQTLLANGTASKNIDFPWHVGVYRKKSSDAISPDYVCGGSIISPSTVISVAHCFTDYSDGSLLPKEQFFIAAGKYYRNWDVPEDNQFAQKRNVNGITIPSDIYRGSQTNLAGDIAIIVLDQPFVLTKTIRPVCVDWNLDLVDQQLIPNQLGEVVGWGWTESNTQSLVLQHISLPFVERGKCLDDVPGSFKPFITIDKFCGSSVNGTNICNVGSGAGVVFADKITKKYYFQGIVSVGPVKQGSCDHNQIGAMTKVAQYIPFIKSNQII